MAETTTSGSGTYSFSSIADGTYTVRFDADDTQYVDAFFGGNPPTTITITAGSASTGIDATLAAAGVISGTVKNAGGTDIQAPVNIFDATETLVRSTTSFSGVFSIAGLPVGTYKIQTGRDPSKIYAESWFGGTSFATATAITVATGSPATPAIVVPIGGSLTGTIKTAGGSPIAGVEVTVYRANGDFFDTATTAANGEWTVIGMMADDFRIDYGSVANASPSAIIERSWFDGQSGFGSADDVAVTLGNATAMGVFTATLINPAPVAVADSTYTTTKATALTVAAPGVLSNDTGTSLTVTANSDPAGGTAAVAANGGFTYTPDANTCGADTFTYTLSDGVTTTTGTVTVTVTCPDPPFTGTIAQASTIEEIIAASDYRTSDGDILRLYRAFFERDADVEGAKYWIAVARAGANFDDLAYGFANSTEFTAGGPALTNLDYVRLLYRNMLGREGEQAGVDYWVGLMNSGNLSQPGVVRWIAANNEFINRYPYLPTT